MDAWYAKKQSLELFTPRTIQKIEEIDFDPGKLFTKSYLPDLRNFIGPISFQVNVLDNYECVMSSSQLSQGRADTGLWFKGYDTLEDYKTAVTGKVYSGVPIEHLRCVEFLPSYTAGRYSPAVEVSGISAVIDTLEAAKQATSDLEERQFIRAYEKALRYVETRAWKIHNNYTRERDLKWHKEMCATARGEVING